MRKTLNLILVGTVLAAAPVIAASPANPTEAAVGYFSEMQVERAEPVYAQHCASCHGAQPEQGSAAAPPLAGLPFMFYWEGKSVLELFEYTQETMPQTRPGSLTQEQYIDLVAYILSANDLPSGDQELSFDPDRLAELLIVSAEPEGN